MTKEKYMALADVQSLWSNDIKPHIYQTYATKQELQDAVEDTIDGVSNTTFVFEENAQATSTTQPSTTASAGTLKKIYLVGAGNGTKYQWITLEDTSTTPSTYSWSNIGTTEITLTVATEANIRAIVTNYIS